MRTCNRRVQCRCEVRHGTHPRDQCIEAGVAYFHKQGNADGPDKDRFLDGRLWEEYPDVLSRAEQGALI